MRLFIFTVSSDSSAGRVGKSSFSDQTLMEMIVEGIASKENICGDFSQPKDTGEWKGFEIVKDEVQTIIGDYHDLRGTLLLEWLPLTALDACCNELTGNIDLANLPAGMTTLTICRSDFTGPMDLKYIPENMVHLGVSNNGLTRILRLNILPEIFETLQAADNNF